MLLSFKKNTVNEIYPLNKILRYIRYYLREPCCGAAERTVDARSLLQLVSPPLVCGSHCCVLCLCEFHDFTRLVHVESRSMCTLVASLSHSHNVFRMPQIAGFPCLRLTNTLLYVQIVFCLPSHPSMDIRVIPPPGYCEQCCCECANTNISLKSCS